MALTNIFTGMEKGPEAIDANFKALGVQADYEKLKVGDWQTTGITGLNGVVLENPKYRISQYGDLKILQFDGVASNFNANASTVTNIAKFPAGLVPDNALLSTGNIKPSGGGTYFALSYWSDGTAAVTTWQQVYGGWKFSLAQSIVFPA